MSGTNLTATDANGPRGLLTSALSSIQNGFDLTDISWPQVAALVGVVLIATLAWRQVINFVAEEI